MKQRGRDDCNEERLPKHSFNFNGCGGCLQNLSINGKIFQKNLKKHIYEIPFMSYTDTTP